jgi:hypothetical protein
VPNSAVISGLPGPTGVFDHPGLDQAFTNTSTAVECQEVCGEDTVCQAFTFVDGFCALKSAIPSTSECASCRSGSYRAELFHDRFGGDLRLLNTSRSLECAAACVKDTQCRAWTYGVPRHGGPGACWLKSKAAAPVYNPNHPAFFPFVSGLRRGIDYHVDRPGGDYKNFDAGAPEPERCQTACEQDSQCKA